MVLKKIMYYLYSSEFYDWIIKVKIAYLQNEKKMGDKSIHNIQ